MHCVSLFRTFFANHEVLIKQEPLESKHAALLYFERVLAAEVLLKGGRDVYIGYRFPVLLTLDIGLLPLTYFNI